MLSAADSYGDPYGQPPATTVVAAAASVSPLLVDRFGRDAAWL
jgi:hypothetical protein